MCGKTFKTISAVNNHKLSHNKDVKEFACDDPGCVYRTNTVGKLFFTILSYFLLTI